MIGCLTRSGTPQNISFKLKILMAYKVDFGKVWVQRNGVLELLLGEISPGLPFSAVLGEFLLETEVFVTFERVGLL